MNKPFSFWFRIVQHLIDYNITLGNSRCVLTSLCHHDNCRRTGTERKDARPNRFFVTDQFIFWWQMLNINTEILSCYVQNLKMIWWLKCMLFPVDVAIRWMPQDQIYIWFIYKINIGSGNGLVSSGNKQAITWANVDPGLCHQMASPGHNELRWVLEGYSI